MINKKPYLGVDVEIRVLHHVRARADVIHGSPKKLDSLETSKPVLAFKILQLFWDFVRVLG